MTELSRAQMIAMALQRAQLRVSSEAVLQIDIATALTAGGFPFERECSLSAKDRPDFMSEDVAIEAKARYGKKKIYRQLERYAAHDRVKALILVTNTAMGMPPEINGKPVYVVSTGLSYL
jgi:hypothetical protein